METPSANFLARNILEQKDAVYLVHFEGETDDYVTSERITAPIHNLKPYLKKISGNSQKITPEEGRSDIGSMTASILDFTVAGVPTITSLIANDPYNMQRKRAVIKAGYAGMAEADMLTVLTGWVTDNKLWSDHLGYDFTITDLQKWLQRKIFRESETTPVVMIGNPLNILLAILTSTGGADIEAATSANPCQITWTDHGRATGDIIVLRGITQADWVNHNGIVYTLVVVDDDNFTLTGFNSLAYAAYVPATDPGVITVGEYDWYAETDGLGLDPNNIRMSHIEDERDKWFAGARFAFDIREPIVAKKFLEDEIFKVCGMYPIIRGDGSFDIKVYRPPLPEEWGDIQIFDSDVIIGAPSWDQNLKGLINEVQFSYDYDADDKEYDSEIFFTDSTSVVNRGPGKKTPKIQSRGLTTARGALEFIKRRYNKIKLRYCINGPPPIIKLGAFFSRNLSEAGDVVPVTDATVPNLKTGTRGITEDFLEIIDRQIDWMEGICKFTMLYTSYTGKRYKVISPAGTVLAGINNTTFTVTDAAEAAKFEVGWHIDIFYRNMLAVGTNRTITDITGNQITVAPALGAAPAAGWKITFSTYDNCTDDQKNFGFIGNALNQVGAAGDDGYYIC